MIGWLIYQQTDAKENATYIQWFLEEANKQNIQVTLIYRENISIGIVNGKKQLFVHGISEELPDFIVNRSIEPLFQQFFANQQIPTFNNIQTASIANHKAITHLALCELNVPMMPTFFLQGRALPHDPPLAYPIIVKSATGRGGEEVFFIQHRQEWIDFQQTATHTDYVVQPTDVQLGKDVRVFIIGKEIIAAVLRTNEHDFRANFKLGGTASLYPLTNQEKTMIRRICSYFDFGLVGIDFLIDHQNNLIFNEIEDVVGSRILSDVTNINLLEKYISFIIKTVKEHKNSNN